jgi:hypothetical protein
VSDTSRLCDCGHSQAVHVGLQRECQATVPTHCQCKAWMHAVENVGTDKRRAPCSKHPTEKDFSNNCYQCLMRWAEDEKARPVVNAHDPVAAPRHYLQHPAGIECIDVVEHMPFNLGNAIKYIWRSGKKGDIGEDLRKAIWYLERELKRVAK